MRKRLWITLVLSGIFSLAALTTDGLAQTTERVSVVHLTGAQATGGASSNPAISSDGNFVAFESLATNLLGTGVDTHGLADIFVHDTTTGTTTRVSVVDVTGAEATGGASSNPSISSDGRFVAFESVATNLLGTGVDTNGLADIFVHDTTTGATTRVSVASSGAQATGGPSSNPSISSNGRFVVFQSAATNLVTGDTAGFQDIFVHDRQTGQTTRVSVSSSGAEATAGNSLNPSIAPEGRFVAFESLATNLVTGDTNASSDTFVHDRGASSVSDGGAGGDGGCFIDTAAGFMPRHVSRSLFLFVAAAAFAAAVRLKTR